MKWFLNIFCFIDSFIKLMKLRTLSPEIWALNFAFKFKEFKNPVEVHSYTLWVLGLHIKNSWFSWSLSKRGDIWGYVWRMAKFQMVWKNSLLGFWTQSLQFHSSFWPLASAHSLGKNKVPIFCFVALPNTCYLHALLLLDVCLASESKVLLMGLC